MPRVKCRLNQHVLVVLSVVGTREEINMSIKKRNMSMFIVIFAQLLRMTRCLICFCSEYFMAESNIKLVLFCFFKRGAAAFIVIVIELVI